MKTALQELIELWESEKGSFIPNAPIYRAFIEEAKTFLPKEKQQIVDAWDNSTAATTSEDTGLEYYNLTYKN